MTGSQQSAGIGAEPGLDAQDVTLSDNDPNNFRFLRVGTGGGGTLKVTTVAGTDKTFNNVQDGEYIWVSVRKVWSTGTSVSNIDGFI